LIIVGGLSIIASVVLAGLKILCDHRQAMGHIERSPKPPEKMTADEWTRAIEAQAYLEAVRSSAHHEGPNQQVVDMTGYVWGSSSSSTDPRSSDVSINRQPTTQVNLDRPAVTPAEDQHTRNNSNRAPPDVPLPGTANEAPPTATS